jgi:hypothetical protein
MDGSSYFRGLLLLIRKDGKISDAEAALMKRVGKSLGFEREFCENAINELLDNPHIVREPPEFSRREVAEKFVLDGITLAVSDGEAHAFEREWLRRTAEKNGLDREWFADRWDRATDGRHDAKDLEVDALTVEFSASDSSRDQPPR